MFKPDTTCRCPGEPCDLHGYVPKPTEQQGEMALPPLDCNVDATEDDLTRAHKLRFGADELIPDRKGLLAIFEKQATETYIRERQLLQSQRDLAAKDGELMAANEECETTSRRVVQLERDLAAERASHKITLDREAATTARYDAKLDKAEADLAAANKRVEELEQQYEGYREEARKCFTRDADRIAQLETEKAQAEDSLRKLSNEAAGFLAMADRQTHGNTNMAVMRMRIDDARALLATLRSAPKEGEQQ